MVKSEFKKSINRIIIGDVGSGKTIVAFLISLVYLYGPKNDGQIALMAPTEVLAVQHYKSLLNYKNNLEKEKADFDLILLTSKEILINGEKFTKSQFTKISKDENKNLKLSKKLYFIGTQALLFNQFVLPNMVLVDEQHRFGVNQRQFLTKNKDSNPHFISFTATPIPRTLALTLYSSLKPHFLETLEDRKTIKTSLETFERFESKVILKIKKEIEKGRKIYIVCPKIEENLEGEEKDELWSVNKAKKFFEKYFPEQILTVHGKDSTKKDIIKQFKESSEKNILIATTVIEVGIDVPDASLMIILNAERFGLAALHQIRGRVGRNDFEDNECVLITYQKYSFSKRLKYLVELKSGFDLAEKDLEIRGSGEMFGKTQSGFDGETERLIGLNPDLYKKINTIVNTLNFENLEDLPRLKLYLEKESQKIWEE